MTIQFRPAIFSAVACILVSGVLESIADSDSSSGQLPEATAKGDSKANVTERLSALNSLVGEWKGVGQLKRGSRKGAWTEKLSCQWSFRNTSGLVELNADGGRLFSRLQLSWDQRTQMVVLTQITDDFTRRYLGKLPDQWPGRFVLKSAVDDEGVSYRCVIHQLSDIRATVLFEKRTTPNGSFRRIAGIGYTRAGAKLAIAGAAQRKCIVTGGLGTIPVTHAGKTYYVCCRGCVEAFNQTPETFIADYKASLKEQQ